MPEEQFFQLTTQLISAVVALQFVICAVTSVFILIVVAFIIYFKK